MLPIEIDTDQCMRDIADNISKMVGKKYGFMVMVFPFGESGGVAHYISNAKREDMVKSLREKADVLEQGLDIQNKGMSN